MLGKLLNKILPKKKEKPPLVGRELYGRNNVGYPTMQLSKEVDDMINKPYRSIKLVAKFYKETLFFKWAPGIINSSLDDEQLKNLSGRNVQMVYLLLFRDMLRHISKYVTPKKAPENWADLLAQEILDNCNMLGDSDDQDVAIKQQLFSQTEPYHIESEEPESWAEPIANLICVPAKDLYLCHHSLMSTIFKKVGKKKAKKAK